MTFSGLPASMTLNDLDLVLKYFIALYVLIVLCGLCLYLESCEITQVVYTASSCYGGDFVAHWLGHRIHN